jgi:putative hydrolase of the HAD superfamily
MESKPGLRGAERPLGGVTHVFLDAGGTLLFPEPSAADIFRRALSTRGHHVDRETVSRILRTPEMIVSLIRPLDPERAAEYYREVNARVIEHLGFELDDAVLDGIHNQFNAPVTWKTYPEALGILRDLRKVGFRLGIISNASPALPETLRKTGIAEYLDTIVCSADVGAEKPHPKIFRVAMARSGITPERALHVGDSYEEDYLGARNAGLHALLLAREGPPPSPCPSIRSLTELSALLGAARSRK